MLEAIKEHWLDVFENRKTIPWYARKLALFAEREAEIVKITGAGRLHQAVAVDGMLQCRYLLHLSYFIRQGETYYIEEQVLPMEFEYADGEIRAHQETEKDRLEHGAAVMAERKTETDGDTRFVYDRAAAVRYAERWWNDFNPAFRKFEDDCTNFISQCLLAGGAPMHGQPNRSKGWWYTKDTWSYSWTVAHAMRWYLSGAQQGIRGRAVETPQELALGDVICIDFEGNGRWDHTTIVVAKDEAGMPLVNAHTNNSRHRYWTYEDSAAWTPQAQYKFFQLVSQ